MNTLTTEQVEFIARKIERSNIKSNEMKEDLVDHFCCSIEEEMQKGTSFQIAYDKAYQNTCPNGFDEIQRETVFLLTFKKIKAMKRMLYISGYLTTIFAITTLYLKLMHWPGGSIGILVTFMLLIFLFLPALFSHLYKRELVKNTGSKLQYIIGYTGVTLLLAATLFKIMHWPFVISLAGSSLVILNFVFFPFLFVKMYRKSVAKA